MNKPVSFGLAKLLKEKKFNTIESKLIYASNSKLTESVYDFDDWCFAPTIAEVVMWLYEKHGIWVYVKQGYKWEWYIETIKNNPELTYRDGLENSPTEAYEAAIKYTFEYIID